MRALLKYLFYTWLFFMVVFLCKYLFVYLFVWQTFTVYPAYSEHVRSYHSTREINLAVKLDNDANPYYTWMDLSKYMPIVEDSDDAKDNLRIYAYGPVEDMKKFSRRVMIVCGQHGRELVSSELCYAMIRLLQLYVREDETFTRQLSQHTLDGVGYWIVPVMCPWARQHVECGDYERQCQRTNARYVDLNRNFLNAQKTNAQRRLPGDETYPGDHPMSEYETLAVAKLLDYVEPHVLFNVHSGGEDILLPYDGTYATLPPNYEKMLLLARRAREASKCRTCGLGTSSVLYADADDKAIGTLVDYAIDYAKVDLAYTLEIFVNASARTDDCRSYFNPRPGDDLARVLRRWTAFLLGFVDSLIEITK